MVRPESRAQPLVGRQMPSWRHQLDYTFRWPELRSVDFTAAAKDNPFLLAVDAAYCTKNEPFKPAVGATSAGFTP